MTKKLRLNDTIIKTLPLSGSGHYYVSDTDFRGLKVRIGKRDKVFCFVKRVKNGPMREITIGPYPFVTTASAKIRCSELMQSFLAGVDPVSKHITGSKSVTFKDLFDDFLKDRRLKPLTRKQNYIDPFDRHIKTWFKLSVTDITPDLVYEKFVNLTENGTYRIASISNLFRSVKAVFAYGMLNEKYGLSKNPCQTLWTRGKIEQSGKRDTIISEHELPLFYSYIIEHLKKNLAVPDLCLVPEFLLFVLFSGCRRGEAENLKWENVDFVTEIITFSETKTGTDRTIPFSSVLKVLLKRRQAVSQSLYVFDSKRSKTGHLAKPFSFMEKMCEKTGIKSFSVHDLRRTYITYAKFLDSGVESSDFSSLACDFLVGHVVKNVSNKHYVRPSVRMLKPAQEAISMRLLSLCGVSVAELEKVLN
jgi:integrase